MGTRQYQTELDLGDLLTLTGTITHKTAVKWVTAIRTAWGGCPLKPNFLAFFANTTGVTALQPMLVQILWRLAQFLETACSPCQDECPGMTISRVSYEPISDTITPNDQSLPTKLFNYLSVSVEESTKHKMFSIGVI